MLNNKKKEESEQSWEHEKPKNQPDGGERA
jgi:hypothetical protein